MNPLHSSKTIPAWQIERANRLHRACLSIQSKLHGGEKICKALRSVARRHNGKSFESDPARQMRLSPQTLRRAWNAWRRGGERPSAFQLQFADHVPTITAPVVVRFVEFCARSPRASLKSAWENYAAHGGYSGRGRRAAKPLKFSYSSICRYFPAKDFVLIQGHLKSIQLEQTKLAKLRFAVATKIRSRLPESLPRRRPKHEINFEI